MGWRPASARGCARAFEYAARGLARLAMRSSLRAGCLWAPDESHSGTFVDGPRVNRLAVHECIFVRLGGAREVWFSFWTLLDKLAPLPVRRAVSCERRAGVGSPVRPSQGRAERKLVQNRAVTVCVAGQPPASTPGLLNGAPPRTELAATAGGALDPTVARHRERGVGVAPAAQAPPFRAPPSPRFRGHLTAWPIAGARTLAS
jgi:hypothetical protein